WHDHREDREPPAGLHRERVLGLPRLPEPARRPAPGDGGDRSRALKNGKLSLVWSQDQTTLSFTTLVGQSGKRVLIGTDIPIKFQLIPDSPPVVEFTPGSRACSLCARCR